MAARLASGAVLIFAALGLSCAMDRPTGDTPPVYATDVKPILAERCASCHQGEAPSGGWRATSFLDAIACVASGAPATIPTASRAPIISALDSPAHQGVLRGGERALLEAWVSAGAPAFRGTVHAAGIVDPRSEAWHGKLLRDQHWAPMLDGDDANACGRCHDGSVARPANVTTPAPGATACTTCHKDDKGVLACGTCHGMGDRAYPPRDPCFFPADAALGNAHVKPASADVKLVCSTCHPAPGEEVIGGTHGNGTVELGDGSGKCGACHGAGDDPWPSTGAHPSHKSPALTLAVACTDCHAVPAAIVAPGHMNGVVEIALTGRAIARDAPAAWDGHSCSSVACHGAKLNDAPAITPSWTDTSHAASACGACHGIPPTQHTASTSCERSTCHSDEILRTFTSWTISESGKALHINGAIDPAR
jgi:predicted CxxxxCH...CXXCH cytochrome family protein